MYQGVSDAHIVGFELPKKHLWGKAKTSLVQVVGVHIAGVPAQSEQWVQIAETVENQRHIGTFPRDDLGAHLRWEVLESAHCFD